MKVMVTAIQTTKAPWMRRVWASRAVARRLAERTARASSESRVVVGAAVEVAVAGRVEEAADTGVPSVPVRWPRAADVDALTALGGGEDVRTGGLLAGPGRA